MGEEAGVRSVEEHLAAVLGLVRPLEVTESGLLDARGCASSADVRATSPLPAFDNSAMDGYAVLVADVATAPVTLPVADDIPAGRQDVAALRPGTVQRIMTGAPLPQGADGIVPVEWTDGGTEQVRIEQPPERGQHVRRAGEDVAPGSVVLHAGDELTPARLGLLASLGRGSVPVRRRPVVAVLSTGSELVEPGEPLAHGQIYDSNSYLLAACVDAAGGVGRRVPFVADDVPACESLLHEVAGWADLVLTSGGISAGAYEVVKLALTRTGTVEFVQVAMQPGKPQGYGTVDGTPVVTLPGNPVSSFVSFEVFVRPALRALMGHRRLDRPVHTGHLVEPLRSPAGRRRYLRGGYDAATGEVRLVGGAGSHLLGALAHADCLVVVPDDVTELPAGAELSVLLVDP